MLSNGTSRETLNGYFWPPWKCFPLIRRFYDLNTQMPSPREQSEHGMLRLGFMLTRSYTHTHTPTRQYTDTPRHTNTNTYTYTHQHTKTSIFAYTYTHTHTITHTPTNLHYPKRRKQFNLLIGF